MSRPAKQPKLELLLATWPDQPGVRYFGHADFVSSVSGCDSLWLSLRGSRAGETAWMDDDARAASDIGLYCWFGDTGTLQFEFAIHDVSNMRLREAEARLKLLRKLDKAMPALRNRTADTFRMALMDIFNAIGVTRAIEYRYMVPTTKATFIPIYDAVEKIGQVFDKRYANIKKEVANG